MTWIKDPIFRACGLMHNFIRDTSHDPGQLKMGEMKTPKGVLITQSFWTFTLHLSPSPVPKNFPSTSDQIWDRWQKPKYSLLAGWKAEHLQRLRCYWCYREQPDLHCNHFKLPCSIHSPSCNFEMLSLPHNFSAGYFSFALTQNEPQLLAGSTCTTPHVDGLRATKTTAHHSHHFSLQVLVTLCTDHLLSFPNWNIILTRE